MPRLTVSLALTLALLMPVSAAAQATPPIDEPHRAELPDACGYLNEALAHDLLRAEVRPGPANEHIPTFWSQCVYSGRGVVGREVGFVFKFMLHELSDVATLSPEQLDFNASFAVGALPVLERRTDLGKVSFVFEDRSRTTLMMVTGIQGPPDGAQRPTEFIATYHLADPDTPHADRLEALLGQARQHLQEWLAGG